MFLKNIYILFCNLRMRIRDNGQTADIISGFDYKPFGEKMPVMVKRK